MELDMKLKPVKSQEFEIDGNVENLLGKLVAGSLTPAEESQYQQLLIQRSRLMRSPISGRFKKRSAA